MIPLSCLLLNKDMLSELVELIFLLSDVPFDRALLQVIMEIYDTLIKGLKV